MRCHLRAACAFAAALILLMVPARALAQESKSAPAATELAKLLDGAKLDSVAAKLGSDHFVAALYFPGSQLLVVKARYSAYERMDDQIARKNYRDVYIDLNSASIPQSKVFVSDGGADGLFSQRRPNQLDSADVGGKSYSFDGDWKKAKISEQDYIKAFQSSDAEYSAMLQALIAVLKKPS